MGGLVGGLLVYANYFHAIDIFEGGRGVRTLSTASLFSTYAVRFYPSLLLNSSDVARTVGLHDERFVLLFRSACHCCSHDRRARHER